MPIPAAADNLPATSVWLVDKGILRRGKGSLDSSANYKSQMPKYWLGRFNATINNAMSNDATIKNAMIDTATEAMTRRYSTLLQAGNNATIEQMLLCMLDNWILYLL